jgi:hypothetical protein
MSRVAAMAITPSLNASMREVSWLIPCPLRSA